MAAIVQRHGRLDVLVHNAGGSPPVDAATVSPRFHEGVIRPRFRTFTKTSGVVEPCWPIATASSLTKFG